MGTDATLLKAALAQSLTSVVVGVVVFLGAIFLMALIDPLLLAVALASIAVATAVVLVVATKIRVATEEAQASVGALGAALERTIRAIRTVKISRAEDREEEAISGEAKAAYEAGVRAAAYEAPIGPATNVALQGSFIPVLGVGARLASGNLGLEDLVAFLLYLVGPLVMVFASFTELQQGLAAMGRIGEVLELPVEAGSSGLAPEPGVKSVAARLDRVRFGYGPECPVLEDVSFETPGSGLTALVGTSGAGKFTVFALLSRFYEADSGSVSVGGTDVRHLPLNELRARVAYVEQDAPVLAGTVRQNLLYANPGASDGELEEVIDLANLRAFAEKLPESLDAEVGDSGTLLSGGAAEDSPGPDASLQASAAPARRGHLPARRRERAGAKADGSPGFPAVRRPGHRLPALYHRAGRKDPAARRRQGFRRRHPRGAAEEQPPLQEARRDADDRSRKSLLWRQTPKGLSADRVGPAPHRSRRSRQPNGLRLIGPAKRGRVF